MPLPQQRMPAPPAPQIAASEAMNDRTVLLHMRRDLYLAGGFRFRRRRRGVRITWPARASLADVLAMYDLLESEA